MNSQSAPKKLSYRAEIDGLRAIAVISVIIYHAQIVLFENFIFQGGYIGVDIFFVISGYLITRIILTELQEKASFCYVSFYERRARRILPVLFLVILVSIPFAFQKLLPSSLVEYAKSIITSIFFSSNYFFYFNTTVYGADSALLKPFLHTWSLGVEEQFYIVFPFLTVLIFKFFRKYFLIVIISLILISLQFSNFMEGRNAELNFYLLQSRFWELAVGSIIAYRELYFKNMGSGIYARFLAMLGLALVAFSIFIFDSSTPHPSYYTVVPVFGVALIIIYASKENFVGCVLSSRFFVWVGLISYSLYLWHYPIFAFSRMGTIEADNYDKIKWIVITIFFSVCSYFLVENPFRKKVSRKLFLISLLTATFILILVSAFVFKTEGVYSKARLGFDYSILESLKPNYFFGDDGCKGAEALVKNESEFCVFGKSQKSEVDFILLGDSHAMHSQNLIYKLSVDLDQKGLFGGLSGCPALMGIYPVRGMPHPSEASEKCYNYNKNAYELVEELNVNTVFLISRWDYYVDGSNSGDLNLITDNSLAFGDIDYVRKIYERAVEYTVSNYQELGVKIVVLLQVPHQNLNVIRVFEEINNSSSISDSISNFQKYKSEGVSVEEHISRQAVANHIWYKLQNKIGSENILIIDPTDVFCMDGRCQLFDDGGSFYTDIDHASVYGFQRLEEKFHSVMLNEK